MQKKIRRVLAALLVFAMVVGFLPVLDLGIAAKAANVGTTDIVYNYVFDISEYRTNKADVSGVIGNLDEMKEAADEGYVPITNVYTKRPVKEGYVFAGWYTDLRTLTPLGQDVVSGEAYAKFVPEQLITAVAQVSTATNHATGSSALRFVAAVDSLEYNQIGFTVSKLGSGSYVHSSTKVYTALSAAVKGGSLEIKEGDFVAGDTSDARYYFGKAAQYMFALTVTGISDQTQSYTAQPFWITLDGTLVNHADQVTDEKTVEMGVEANIAAGKTQRPEGLDWFDSSADYLVLDSKEDFLSFVEMAKTYNFKGRTVKLATDITLSDGVWSQAKGTWAPIGTAAVPFAGTFDGGGHTISGMLTSKPVGAYHGLFGVVNGATIKNLKITNSTFHPQSRAAYYAGSVAAHATNTTIENVYSDATIYAAEWAGGIVGHGAGTMTVSNCWYAGAIHAWNTSTTALFRQGGIVGRLTNSGSSVTNCLFTGAFDGVYGYVNADSNTYVGGIVGMLNYGITTTISDCLSAGDMTGMTVTEGAQIGSVIASGSSKTVSGANIYATTECCSTICTGRPENIQDIVTVVDKANLLGELAKTNASGLDYTGAWVTVADSTPELSAFGSELNTAWYGDGSTSEFTIYTEKDLYGLVYLSKTNTFAGKTIKLGADITVNTGDAADWATNAPAKVWTPIGDSGEGFTGVFDGQGHTISGLYCKTGGYAAFVARLYGATAAVKNVRIVNSYFESTGTGDSFHNAAGIVGRATNGFTVSGVYTDAYFKGVKAVGIVAFSDAGDTNFANCWFDGTMVGGSTATNIGGIVGSVANSKTHTINNCLMTGTISGPSAYAGGLVGIGPYSCAVVATDCLVAGDMTGLTAGVVGSVIGNNPGGNGSTYTDVYVTNETHTNKAGAGGALSKFTVTAVAKADITGTNASTVLTGLDFVSAWSVREDNVPKLGVEGVDISWYNASESEYVLYDAEDLYGFSYLQETLSFAGKTVKLGADIVLNEGDAKSWATTAPANVWEPIGKDDASLTFEGTFDGQGHTISGLYYSSALYGGALFVYTGTNAVIKNLKITNSYIRSTHGADWSATGSVVAFVNGTDFINVYSDAIIDTNSGYTGGIGGRLQGNGATFENCEFAGTITGTGDNAIYIGGILGGHHTNSVGATTYENCVFSGNITGNAYVGGLAGRSSGAAGSTTTVTGAQITGTVNAYNSTNASNAGGLFGLTEVSAVTVNDSSVSGTVNATLGVGGGYIGMETTANVTIENSTFTGAVNGGTKLAGFIGRVNTAGYTATIKNSTFSGTITATSTSESTAAGFVGNVNNGNVTITDSVAEGTVVAPGPYAAGAIAQVINVAGVTIDVERVISTTAVKCASSNAGGIIGRIHGTNPSVTMKNNLAKATFTVDEWCTSQIIAHAQGNAVKIENNFFVQTANSAAAGIESSGGSVSHSPVKVSEAIWNYLRECYEAGMYPDYDGFKDAGFVIKDAADLYGFNIYNQVNGMSGKTVKLGADITVNTGDAADWTTTAPAYNWAPVGTIDGDAGAFAGNFDGQGYTISGLYCAFENGNSMGLFRETSGTITNFKLVNSYFENTVEEDYGYNGTIVAYMKGGTISKVYTDAIIKTIDSYAGGIVGFTEGATATIDQCQFDGILMARCVLAGYCGLTAGQSRAHANYVGGMVGAGTATNTNVTNCYYSGKIYNECKSAHRTAGIIGGLPTAGKGATITGCVSIGEFATLNHERDGNSYHFSMIMDGRAAGGATTNSATLFDTNYVLTQQAYNMFGEKINSGSNISGEQNGEQGTVRYTEEQMIADIENRYANDTAKLDFVNYWNYNVGALPTLKWIDDTDTRNTSTYYATAADGSKILMLPMSGVAYDDYVDAQMTATATGTTTSSGSALYNLTYTKAAAVDFKDIDYGDGTYLTKYTGVTLNSYKSYITALQSLGMKVKATNTVNSDDAYYTALQMGSNVYSVTYFANSGEAYVSHSNEQKLSPYMNADYYKTAVNTAGGEPSKTYSDVTITMVELTNGGLCQVIRLKNGHYIVIDGGTSTRYNLLSDHTLETDSNGKTVAYSDRAELVNALGASAAAYTAGTKNKPQVVVDAWIFTHDHSDHVGWLNGGVYGAMQVDVYIKGFYYNFGDDFRVEDQVKVGGTADAPVYADGYHNQFYNYDATSGYYTKNPADYSSFWVGYSATHKTAANVNTPSWGTKGIPIYRVQAGQKFYFDGITMEVAYTQEQVQPSEYRGDQNASCAWFLFTDDYGHTFLEAGDTEEQNQDAVIALYDDYYDGGSGTNYALFGADVVNAFHHGLNMYTVAADDFTRQNTLFGIQNPTATNATDGRTQFIFYTRGYLNTILGYVHNEEGKEDTYRNIGANYYLTGYIYEGLNSTAKSYAKGRTCLADPIAFAAYGTRDDGNGYYWQGTTTVTFNSSGISWNKSQTTGIYPNGT